jgi:hypothetical protein
MYRMVLDNQIALYVQHLLGNGPNNSLTMKKMKKGFNIKINTCSTSLLQPSETHANRRCNHIFSQEKE